MDTTCKNCNFVCDTQYCGVCGQKMHIKRFDTKHILFHEVPHGIVHLDKGFLLTTKALIKRPGHFIREYIEGKRANHYGPIQYLFIIGIVMGIVMNLVDFNVIANKINEDFQPSIPKTTEVKTNKTIQEIAEKKQREEKIKSFSKKIPTTIANQYKWFIFIMIPASALAGFWMTRKLGYNFAENIIRALYTSGLSGICNIVIAPMMLLPATITLHTFISFILSLIIPTVVWNQFLKIKIPSLGPRSVRILLYWVYQIILVILTIFIIGGIAVIFALKELKSS
jgi:phosphatidylserine synthase